MLKIRMEHRLGLMRKVTTRLYESLFCTRVLILLALPLIALPLIAPPLIASTSNCQDTKRHAQATLGRDGIAAVIRSGLGAGFKVAARPGGAAGFHIEVNIVATNVKDQGSQFKILIFDIVPWLHERSLAQLILRIQRINNDVMLVRRYADLGDLTLCDVAKDPTGIAGGWLIFMADTQNTSGGRLHEIAHHLFVRHGTVKDVRINVEEQLQINDINHYGQGTMASIARVDLELLLGHQTKQQREGEKRWALHFKLQNDVSLSQDQVLGKMLRIVNEAHSDIFASILKGHFGVIPVRRHAKRLYDPKTRDARDLIYILKTLYATGYHEQSQVYTGFFGDLVETIAWKKQEDMKPKLLIVLGQARDRVLEYAANNLPLGNQTHDRIAAVNRIFVDAILDGFSSQFPHFERDSLKVRQRIERRQLHAKTYNDLRFLYATEDPFTAYIYMKTNAFINKYNEIPPDQDAQSKLEKNFGNIIVTGYRAGKLSLKDLQEIIDDNGLSDQFPEQYAFINQHLSAFITGD